MERHETEHIEITLLLEAVYQRYGYDFRSYARASVERRVRRLLSESGVDTVSAMIPLVLHDPSFMDRFIRTLSLTVDLITVIDGKRANPDHAI